MQRVLLQGYPDTKLSILVVWLKMDDADTIDVAQQASMLFSNDSRVTQFYDPAQISGLELAKGFGAEDGEVAWDIYLFYGVQDQWIERLPQPIDWVHQLRNSRWAAAGRFYQGDQLAQKIDDILENLLQSN